MIHNLHLDKETFEAMFDLGESVEPWEVRKRNGAYMEWLGAKHCCACSSMAEKIDVHHVDKPGMAMRCPDEHTVPLCHRKCHLDGLHRGEQTFIHTTGLDTYGDWPMQYVTLYFMASFIRSNTQDLFTAGSPVRSVARRFYEMASDSRLASSIGKNIYGKEQEDYSADYVAL